MPHQAEFHDSTGILPPFHGWGKPFLTLTQPRPKRGTFWVRIDPSRGVAVDSEASLRIPSMAKASPSATPAPPTFEAALSELEGMVASLEGGQMTLEASLAAYKRGAELLKFCRTVLDDAQQQIRILEGDTLREFPGADDAE